MKNVNFFFLGISIFKNIKNIFIVEKWILNWLKKLKLIKLYNEKLKIFFN